MKFLNVILREILLFLEFEDIQKEKLYLVNKQFHHNVIKDNELVRRMFLNHLALPLDYEKEEQFQRAIIESVKNYQQEEESKDDQPMEIKTYENPQTSLFPILMKLQKESNRLLVLCQRSTGGHYPGYSKVYTVFSNSEGFYEQYYSGASQFHPNGLLYC